MQVCLPPSQRPASVTLRGPDSSTGEGPPPPLESVCSALCHPTPRVKDSVKTRLQSPSWHLTPTPSGVGTLFCLLMRPGRNGGGQHLAGNTVPHGRSRSQGCGSQDPPGQVRTQGVWGPGQDSSPRPPPQHTHRMHTSSCHGAHLHHSWPYPWRLHSLPAGLPPKLGHPTPLVPALVG